MSICSKCGDQCDGQCDSVDGAEIAKLVAGPIDLNLGGYDAMEANVADLVKVGNECQHKTLGQDNFVVPTLPCPSVLGGHSFCVSDGRSIIERCSTGHSFCVSDSRSIIERCSTELIAKIDGLVYEWVKSGEGDDVLQIDFEKGLEPLNFILFDRATMFKKFISNGWQQWRIATCTNWPHSASTLPTPVQRGPRYCKGRRNRQTVRGLL